MGCVNIVESFCKWNIVKEFSTKIYQQKSLLHLLWEQLKPRFKIQFTQRCSQGQGLRGPPSQKPSPPPMTLCNSGLWRAAILGPGQSTPTPEHPPCCPLILKSGYTPEFTFFHTQRRYLQVFPQCISSVSFSSVLKISSATWVLKWKQYLN